MHNVMYFGSWSDLIRNLLSDLWAVLVAVGDIEFLAVFYLLLSTLYAVRKTHHLPASIYWLERMPSKKWREWFLYIRATINIRCVHGLDREQDDWSTSASVSQHQYHNNSELAGLNACCVRVPSISELLAFQYRLLSSWSNRIWPSSCKQVKSRYDNCIPKCFIASSLEKFSSS